MTQDCTIVMLIDEDGDYTVGATREEALLRYTEDVRDPNDSELAIRYVELNVSVPLPQSIVASVVVPESNEAANVTVG